MAVSPNNSTSLVGLQKTSIADSTILTNNNFGIDPSPLFEAGYIGGSVYVPSVLKTNPIKFDETFPLDHSNPLNYVKFGSASDYFGGAIGGILDKYPYSYFITPINSLYNILNYIYDPITDKSTFSVPTIAVVNQTGYYYTATPDSTDLKYSLARDFKNFMLSYNGSNYEILDYTAPINATSSYYLFFTIKGNPFNIVGNDSQPFHIKPKDTYYFDFYNQLDGFQRYILSNPKDIYWEFIIQTPFTDSDGITDYYSKTYFFYRSDGYNPDLSGRFFTDGISSFIGLGAEYDENECDIFYKELIPQNLKELNDDTRGSLGMIARAYGRVFDNIRSATLGMPNIFKLSYNGIDNTISSFIPEMAKVFGYKYFDFSSFIGDIIKTKDDLALYNANALLWRNLLINAPWMLSAKGTRRPIIFLFEYFGLDECYYVLDEFFYRFEKPLRLQESLRNIDIRLTELPYNEDGTPKALVGSNIHFQSFDYFDIYEKAGYDWDFLVDNKKSRGGNYGYDVNSKWVEVAVDPYKALECEVYKLNLIENICEPDCDIVEFDIVVGDDIDEQPPIDNDQTVQFFPINKDVSGISFNDYISQAIFTGINARNRKVVGDYYNLLNIYYNYYYRKDELTCIEGNVYGPDEAMQYISAFDTSFMRTVRDFLPATAKVIGGGINVRNVAFSRNKLKYKRGIDESSLFGNNIPPYIFDKEVKYTTINKSLPTLLEDAIDIVGGTITNECPLPCVPEIVEALTRGTEIEIFWECDNPSDIIGYDVERLLAGDCLDCDFGLIESGDIISGGTFSGTEQLWIKLATDLLPNVDRFVDGTQVSGTDYFYRVRAYNACGEEYSDALYVDNVSTFLIDIVEGAIGLAMGKLEVYKWEITGYSSTPPLGTFIQTEGYLAKLQDGLYYPITYDIMSNTGDLDRQEIGYTEQEIPIKLACGNNICPQIYTYTFVVVDTEATINIY